MSGRDDRIRACATDPWLFALTYLRHHITIDGAVSFARDSLHGEVRRYGQRMAADRAAGRTPGPAEERDVWVAPREMGKSTWLFLILPMWAAAYGYSRFIAAFADSGPQAENHLTTFKHELDTNELLRYDFPRLCNPRKRLSGVNEADRHGLYVAESGFIFAARGIDASSLGLKIGAQRPDLIILDDVEPDEASYSDYQMKKRRGTILDAVLPLNIYARVLVVGTVTMAGSIIHQCVKWARGERDKDNEWVASTGLRVHHFQPIIVDPDGTERSAWPEKWPFDYLLSIRSTRSYLKNYANDPMGADGGYWTVGDFRYGRLLAVTRTILSVDPAVTTTKHSDPTGLAVVGYSPSEAKAQVSWARSLRLTGDPLRQRVLSILSEHPEIMGVLVETNQGGDLWRDVFHGLPVPVRTIHQSAPKEVRASWALNHYQRGRVLHTEKLTAAEEEMVSFPKAPHDDLVDAVGTGVNYFLRRPTKGKPGAVTVEYA